MTKVLTVVGTRPEIIRLSRVIVKLESAFDHVLIHTGQNYDHELSGIFFEQLGLKHPDYVLKSASDRPMETIGCILSEIDKILDLELPDAFLVLGDTNSALSCLAAKRKKIPIFHMEAGNRCFDINVPEEINRKIVDHIADVNLPYSALAREMLMSEGLPPELSITTGSPMKEVLDFYSSQIEKSTILNKLNLVHKKFIVVSCHREENVDDKHRLAVLVDILNSLARNLNLPVIVSTHPRTRKHLNQIELELDKLVILLKPLGFFDYNKLQMMSKLVCSDSGTVTEEASILGFSAINLRDTHERHEGMQKGSVIMSGFNAVSVIECVEILDVLEAKPALPEDYDVSDVSDKVVKIIKSYIPYVNKFNWRK